MVGCIQVDLIRRGSVDLGASIMTHFEDSLTAILSHRRSIRASVMSNALQVSQLGELVEHAILEVVEGNFDGLGGVHSDVPGAATGTYDSASARCEWIGHHGANEPTTSGYFH